MRDCYKSGVMDFDDLLLSNVSSWGRSLTKFLITFFLSCKCLIVVCKWQVNLPIIWKTVLPIVRKSKLPIHWKIKIPINTYNGCSSFFNIFSFNLYDSPSRLNILPWCVITSYSIHYTKLYDLFSTVWVILISEQWVKPFSI